MEKLNKSVIILAAGKGTRMESDLPKVLHKVGPKPMVKHVIDAAKKSGCESINIVVGYGSEKVKKELSDVANIAFAKQEEQLGTGHAVQQAIPLINNQDMVIILYGDVPLIKAETLKTLIKNTPKNGIGLLTVDMKVPTGYGRIVRENNEIVRIVEEKDASEIEKAITEVNTGILAANGENLKLWLSEISNSNAQNEYYLTDIIEIAKSKGSSIVSSQPSSEIEVMGANTKAQLLELETEYNKE